jgi:hypothetical protein
VVASSLILCLGSYRYPANRRGAKVVPLVQAEIQAQTA